MEYAAINIGASPQAVDKVRETVLEILNTRADQKTIRLALKTLSASLSADYATISNNIITMNPPKVKKAPTT